jgi:hypothetical protein
VKPNSTVGKSVIIPIDKLAGAMAEGRYACSAPQRCDPFTSGVAPRHVLIRFGHHNGELPHGAQSVGVISESDLYEMSTIIDKGETPPSIGRTWSQEGG